LGPNYQTLKSAGVQYRYSIRRSVIDVEYDRIFLTQGSGFPFREPDVMSRYYSRTDTITVGMPQIDQSWTVEIWEPTTR
jgi:hypothetical protein